MLQDKYIAHSTGNFGFVFEKNKSETAVQIRDMLSEGQEVNIL